MENKNKNNKKEVRKNAFPKPAYALLGIIAVALIVLVAWLIWPHSTPEEADVSERGTVRDTITLEGAILTLENLEEMREQLTTPNPDAHYTISMIRNWRFDTWDTPSENALVRNLEDNTRTVYFDVNLIETDELVFSSPYIPLGAALENFSLDRAVSAGEHEAIITFFLVDDDSEVVATVSSTVSLIIES